MSFFIEEFDKPFQAMALFAVTLTYIVAASTFFRKLKDKRERQRATFLRVLTNGIDSQTISSFSDVLNIYKGVLGIASPDGDFSKARLAGWLRMFLVKTYETGIPDIKNETNKNSVRNIIEQITNFIEEAEAADPHGGLPDLERNIIRDIETFLNADDKTGVQRKISELSTSIQVREDAVIKLQKVTKWSVPLSGIGLLLTIIFGVLSMIKM